MNTKIEALLSKEYACTSEELNSRETIFSIRADTKRPFIKILAYRHCVVVCTSEELHEKIRGILKGKSRDEIFELPYVYGQTIHYIPDLSPADTTMTPRDLSPVNTAAASMGLEWGFLFEKEVLSLRGLTGFGNSLEFAAGGRLYAHPGGLHHKGPGEGGRCGRRRGFLRGRYVGGRRGCAGRLQECQAGNMDGQASDKGADRQKYPAVLFRICNKYRLPDGRIPVRIHSGLGGHVWNDPRRKLRIPGNCQQDDLSIPL